MAIEQSSDVGARLWGRWVMLVGHMLLLLHFCSRGLFLTCFTIKIFECSHEDAVHELQLGAFNQRRAQEAA